MGSKFWLNILYVMLNSLTTFEIYAIFQTKKFREFIGVPILLRRSVVLDQCTLSH